MLQQVEIKQEKEIEDKVDNSKLQGVTPVFLCPYENGKDLMKTSAARYSLYKYKKIPYH